MLLGLTGVPGDSHRVSDFLEARPSGPNQTISCREKNRSKQDHWNSSRWEGVGGWVRLSAIRTFLRLVGARGFGPRNLPDPGSGRAGKLGTASRVLWREWSGRPDLNRGPLAPKASALPGCATPRMGLWNHSAKLGGLCPACSGSVRVCGPAPEFRACVKTPSVAGLRAAESGFQHLRFS